MPSSASTGALFLIARHMHRGQGVGAIQQHELGRIAPIGLDPRPGQEHAGQLVRQGVDDADDDVAPSPRGQALRVPRRARAGSQTPRDGAAGARKGRDFQPVMNATLNPPERPRLGHAPAWRIEIAPGKGATLTVS